MCTVFLKACSLQNSIDLSVLPTAILQRSNSYKKSNKSNESLLAWCTLNSLLLSVTGKDLKEYEITFSSRGKPLINNGFISLSHSDGVVVVGYSSVDFGVDIENVENALKYTAVSKKLGVTDDKSLFKRWTEIESAAKLNDSFSLQIDKNIVIKGDEIVVNGKKIAYTVASFNNFNVKFM